MRFLQFVYLAKIISCFLSRMQKMNHEIKTKKKRKKNPSFGCKGYSLAQSLTNQFNHFEMQRTKRNETERVTKCHIWIGSLHLLLSFLFQMSIRCFVVAKCLLFQRFTLLQEDPMHTVQCYLFRFSIFCGNFFFSFFFFGCCPIWRDTLTHTQTAL